VFQELAAAGEELWFAYSYWFCYFLALYLPGLIAEAGVTIQAVGSVSY